MAKTLTEKLGVDLITPAKLYFGGKAWPRLDYAERLEWDLRFGYDLKPPPHAVEVEAADIIRAYIELVEMTEQKRRTVLRKVRSISKTGESP